MVLGLEVALQITKRIDTIIECATWHCTVLDTCTLSSPRCIAPLSPCGYDFTRVLSMNRKTNRDDMKIIF